MEEQLNIDLRKEKNMLRFLEILKDAKHIEILKVKDTHFCNSLQQQVNPFVQLAMKESEVVCKYAIVGDYQIYSPQRTLTLTLEQLLAWHPTPHKLLLHYLCYFMRDSYENVCNLLNFLDLFISEEQWNNASGMGNEEQLRLAELREILQLLSPSSQKIPPGNVLQKFMSRNMRPVVQIVFKQISKSTLEIKARIAFKRALQLFLTAAFANYSECYYWSDLYSRSGRRQVVADEHAIDLRFLGTLANSRSNHISHMKDVSYNHQSTLVLMLQLMEPPKLAVCGNDDYIFRWKALLSMAHNDLAQPELAFPDKLLSFSIEELRPPYKGLLTNHIANFLLSMYKGDSISNSRCGKLFSQTLPQLRIEPKLLVLRHPNSIRTAMILVEADTLTNSHLLTEVSALISQMPKENSLFLHALSFNNGKYQQCAKHSDFEAHSLILRERFALDYREQQQEDVAKKRQAEFGDFPDPSFRAEKFEEQRKYSVEEIFDIHIQDEEFGNHIIPMTGNICSGQCIPTSSSLQISNAHYEIIQRSFFYNLATHQPQVWWRRLFGVDPDDADDMDGPDGYFDRKEYKEAKDRINQQRRDVDANNQDHQRAGGNQIGHQNQFMHHLDEQMAVQNLEAQSNVASPTRGVIGSIIYGISYKDRQEASQRNIFTEVQPDVLMSSASGQNLQSLGQPISEQSSLRKASASSSGQSQNQAQKKRSYDESMNEEDAKSEQAYSNENSMRLKKQQSCKNCKKVRATSAIEQICEQCKRHQNDMMELFGDNSKNQIISNPNPQPIINFGGNSSEESQEQPHQYSQLVDSNIVSALQQ